MRRCVQAGRGWASAAKTHYSCIAARKHRECDFFPGGLSVHALGPRLHLALPSPPNWYYSQERNLRRDLQELQHASGRSSGRHG